MKHSSLLFFPFIFMLANCRENNTENYQTNSVASDAANAVAAARISDSATDVINSVASDAVNAVAEDIGTSNNEQLSKPEKEIACKKAISKLMGKPTSIMEAGFNAEGYVGVKYIRPDDGQIFINECKFNGNQIIWRGIFFTDGEVKPGRWRDGTSDEKITWTKSEKGISISMTE